MGIRQGRMENMGLIEQRTFWKGKRVLLTGHTGFKGGWLAVWLQQLGAQVTGIGLLPASTPSLYSLANISNLLDSHYVDIRNYSELHAIIHRAAPEIVFHLAAQPLVRASYRDPLETYATNVLGTAHVLEALRTVSYLRVAIMVTTDKVYENKEWCWPYRETDILGGHDPYSASKAASELVIDSYRKAFFASMDVAIASVRAGNVIGGGDWSEDRIIPDIIRAWESKQVLYIRNPHAIRPWQHVLEPLSGYLMLAAHLWEKPADAGAFNFGPTFESFKSVEDLITEAYRHIPGIWKTVEAQELIKETSRLTLSIEKAEAVIQWKPKWSFADAIKHTMEWYRVVNEGHTAYDATLDNLNTFLQ